MQVLLIQWIDAHHRLTTGFSTKCILLVLKIMLLGLKIPGPTSSREEISEGNIPTRHLGEMILDSLVAAEVDRTIIPMV